MARTKVQEVKRMEKESKAAEAGKTPRKSRKMKWRQRARNEIFRLTRNTDPIFPRATMARIIGQAAREATQVLGVPSDFRFKKAAIEALREAGEAFLHAKLTEADKWADHAKRVTLFAGKKGDLRRALEADPTFDVHRFDEVLQEFKDERRALKKEAKMKKRAEQEKAPMAEPTVVVGN